MKNLTLKRNLLILFSLITLSLTFVLCSCTRQQQSADPQTSETGSANSDPSTTEDTDVANPTDTTAAPEPPVSQTTEITGGDIHPPKDPNFTSSGNYDPAFFNDALFIGDSRTVGLKDYANLGTADIFANNGLNVFRIFNESLSLPGKGAVTLTDLLTSRTYGKIYIMLGINEIGYNRNKVVEVFGKVVDTVRQYQPSAKIYIQANLLIQKSRSDQDPVYNNANMRSINEGMASYANGTDIIYIDVNPLFDDGAGNLSEQFTIDDFHLLGKYYQVWVEWIYEQTSV